MQLVDLERVLQWRNHPFVRNNMLHQHEIAEAEHEQWFSKARLEPDRYLLIFEDECVPMGFVNLEFIRKNGVVNWGFYKKYDAAKGIGRAMGLCAINYALHEIGAQKIAGQVLSFNTSSLRYHLALGFQKEGVLRRQFFDGQVYHDIVVFGLLAHEAMVKA
ncbi:MAG: UDP-4-amino-4,6-dideoxy-N-acetyl-beta-L-altrosamine N-acetyltransferase [Legionellaceae bacterium]|nr:UDP-4-amino-4,6-dideoxy-N-acetyl-beta-L-altrosamine N-acetyltransferase [Legionellaceae bacterium]